MTKKLVPVPCSDGTITLSQERLSTSTSETYESRCRRWRKRYTLTDAQRKILQKQGRRIGNREAAKKSRTRKRHHIEDLERENDELRAYVEELEGHQHDQHDQLAHIAASQDVMLAHLERLVHEAECDRTLLAGYP